MPYRKHAFVEGEYYHIYNRGNSKQIIFHDKEDYYRFVSLLYACNGIQRYKSLDLKKNTTPYDFFRGEQIVSIIAYSLMPNHFHILIQPRAKDGISIFMQKLVTAYVMYYNKKYKRTGSLFEGKFKSIHVDSDVYLRYLISYIHLNPVDLFEKDWKVHGLRNKKKVFEHLQAYTYSSLVDFLQQKRIQNVILDYKEIPHVFLDRENVVKELLEWLTYQRNPLGKT